MIPYHPINLCNKLYPINLLLKPRLSRLGHRRLPWRPLLHLKRAETAYHRLIRRGFEPSPRLVVLRAPAIHKGLQTHRNPSSIDHRCQQSIECSVRCLGWNDSASNSRDWGAQEGLRRKAQHDSDTDNHHFRDIGGQFKLEILRTFMLQHAQARGLQGCLETLSAATSVSLRAQCRPLAQVGKGRKQDEKTPRCQV